MSLWLLMTMLCSAAAVGISIPLIRKLDQPQSTAMDIAVYEDQLKEIDRDLLSGTINRPEAEAAKLEIQRRLSRAVKSQTIVTPLSARWRNFSLIASAGVVIIGSVSLYSSLGRPDLVSAPRQPGAKPAVADQNIPNDAVEKITAQLKANPKDAQGWRMLGLTQFNLQQYPEAAEAYAKALALEPDNIDFKSAYGEAVVQVAQGIVTPAAQALFADVLSKNPKEPRARYYDAIMHEQAADKSGALERWTALLADTPADAGWRNDVRQRIEVLGKALGRDVTAGLATPGPALSEEQKASVAKLAPAEQQKMIETMVERLASRLVANPNDSDGWIGLMRAYKVLDQPEKAKQAKRDGLTAFTTDAAQREKISAAAKELGVN